MKGDQILKRKDIGTILQGSQIFRSFLEITPEFTCHANYLARKNKTKPAQKEYKELIKHKSIDWDQPLSSISPNQKINDTEASSTSPITDANSNLLTELLGASNASKSQGFTIEAQSYSNLKPMSTQNRFDHS